MTSPMESTGTGSEEDIEEYCRHREEHMSSVSIGSGSQLMKQTQVDGSDNRLLVKRQNAIFALHKLMGKLSELDLSCQIVPEDRLIMKLGGHSEVYMGRLKNSNVVVCVKQIRIILWQDWACATKIAREMRVWSKLEHVNILPLLGFVLEKDGIPSFISEWMENGTVVEYIKNKSGVTVFEMIKGIAAGLSYMHSIDIVHGDMKGNNVVVSEAGIPKIMDFGISHVISSTTTVETATDAYKGTVRWMSRELLFSDENNEGDNDKDEGSQGEDETQTEDVRLQDEDDIKLVTHTQWSDVWAFGMTVLELLTLKVPYHNFQSDSLVLNAIFQNRLPRRPYSCKEPMSTNGLLWDLCQWCWEKDPLKRPSMQTILVERLVPQSPQLEDLHNLQVELHNIQDEYESTSDDEKALSQLMKKLANLNISDKLSLDRTCVFGSGQTDIYRSKLVDGREVAVKIFRFDMRDSMRIMKRITRELRICSKVDHENVLPPLGFIEDRYFRLGLVTPWVDAGSLRKYMDSDVNIDIDEHSLILGIARGLEYLHSKNIVHGHLKPENILIAADSKPMLMDFGLSHLQSSTSTIESATDGPLGNISYMAIELLTAEVEVKLEHTTHSDVWAFGMISQEFLTRRRPYPRVTRYAIHRMICNGVLPHLPPEHKSWDSCNQMLWLMCVDCWAEEPKSRPDMPALLLRILDIREVCTCSTT